MVYGCVNEEALGSLLDDDGLVSESEERVLKGVVRWVKGGGGGAITGEGPRAAQAPIPIHVFRFFWEMPDEARGMLPDCTGLEGLVLESEFL